jgi:hypothetical protein
MNSSIYCPHCQKHTDLQLAQYGYTDAYGRRAFHPALWNTGNQGEWWIGVCNSCGQPVLVRNDVEIVYPAPLPPPSDSNLPKALKEDLDEAKRCFFAGSFRACAVLARRCIQVASLEKGAKKHNLVEQISELTAAGIITKDLEEWATVVRFIGNDAAHPNAQGVSREDAEDCLRLAEQFLHVLFVTPALAKARRTARGK